MHAISKEIRPLFQEALLGAVAGASIEHRNKAGTISLPALELKVRTNEAC